MTGLQTSARRRLCARRQRTRIDDDGLLLPAESHIFVAIA
jgi:hypothetical protein